MPSGHTNHKTIAQRPLTAGMVTTLAYVREHSPRWADLTTAQQNQVRALADRGLADYDLKGICTATGEEIHARA